MVFTVRALDDAFAGRLDASPPFVLVTSALAVATTFFWFTRSRSSESQTSPDNESSGTQPYIAIREPHTLPTSKPFVSDTFDLVSHMDDLHDWMTTWTLHFKGKPFRMRMVGVPDINVLYTPQHFEDVFKNQFESFPKGPLFADNTREVLGQGILAVDGKPWLHQRKIASHMFSMRAMRDSMAATIAKHLKQLCRVFEKTARSQNAVDLSRLLHRFTMQAFVEIGFGVEMDAIECAQEHPLQLAMDRVQQVITCRFMRPAWFWKLQRWLNVGAEADMKQAVATLDAAVLEIVGKALKRRASAQASSTAPSASRGLVSLFLDHVDTLETSERGELNFNASFLRDLVMNFLIAGRDTTAQALSWLVVELSDHPLVERTMREEIARTMELCRAETTSDMLSMSDLSQLVYVEAVIRETLRLHPVIPISSKYVARDAVLSDGTLVREGSSVSIAVYAMARMPFVWGPDAAEFKPSRWIDPATGKLRAESPYKFISFNAGPRQCLGMNLAMMEMKMVLATLLSQFHVQLVVPAHQVTYANAVSLPIKGELLARIQSAPLFLSNTS